MNSLKKILIITTSLLLTASCMSRETIELTPQNTINLRGEVSESSSSQVITDYLELSKNSTEQLYLVINSPGGDVMAGLALLKFLKTVTNLKTICMTCVSMAHIIVEHIPGERLGTSDNEMMQHRAAGSIRGQINDGEMESRLAHLKNLLKDMEVISANRIGISPEEYKAKIVNEWWSYGEQSVSEGLLDRLVDIKCSQDLIDAKKSRTEESFFGSYEIVEYQCPLLVFPAQVKAL